MLSILLSCLLIAAPTQRGERPANSAMAEEAQVAVRRLEAAFKKDDAQQLIEALARAAHVNDSAVVKSTNKAFLNRDAAVRLAAIEALRFNPHRSALRSLHNELAKPIQGPRSTEITAALIQAVCQKGQAGSLPAITAPGLDRSSSRVLSAWVLGMGRLRSFEALDELVAQMRALPKPRRVAHMDEFRCSLMQLSGEDHGTDYAAWVRWWSQEGQSVEVRPRAPKTRGMLRQEWCHYWSIAPEEPHPTQFDVGEVAIARIASAPRPQANKTGERPDKNQRKATPAADQTTERPKRNPKRNQGAADESDPTEAPAKTKRNADKRKNANRPKKEADGEAEAQEEAPAEPKAKRGGRAKQDGESAQDPASPQKERRRNKAKDADGAVDAQSVEEEAPAKAKKQKAGKANPKGDASQSDGAGGKPKAGKTNPKKAAKEGDDAAPKGADKKKGNANPKAGKNKKGKTNA